MRFGQDEWSDERVAELERHWDAGLTASAAAAEMGLSRCAVIGKVHRLGLNRRGVALLTEEEHEQRKRARNKLRTERARIAKAKERGEQIVQMPRIEPVAPMPVRSRFEGSLNIPLADLRMFSNRGPNQCRYIADEPPGPDYLACGNGTLPGESWCGHCREIVMPKSTKTQPERLQHIRVGVVNHLRSRKAA